MRRGVREPDSLARHDPVRYLAPGRIFVGLGK